MSILFPSIGKKTLLDKALKDSENALTIRLYSNDVTPANSDTAASYTEVTGGGYAAVGLTGADWSSTNATPSVATCAQKTFGFTGAAGNVYGYFVTNADGSLVWAERFSAMRTINYDGDAIKITMTINANSI